MVGMQGIPAPYHRLCLIDSRHGLNQHHLITKGIYLNRILEQIAVLLVPADLHRQCWVFNLSRIIALISSNFIILVLSPAFAILNL